MENNLQTQQNNTKITLNKIQYKPSYSIMYMSNLDLQSALVKNLRAALGCTEKELIGAIIEPVNRDGLNILNAKVVFRINARLFERSMPVKLASLIRAQEEIRLSKEAIDILRAYFLAPGERVDLRIFGEKNHLVELKLNGMAVLASLIKTDSGLLRLQEFKKVDKGNYILSLMNYEKVNIVKPNNKKKNNKNRK